MYDTVAVTLDAPGVSLGRARCWERLKATTNTSTGARQERLVATLDGLSLTLFDGGRLRVERSLPKALTGQNVVDLRGDQVEDALRAVDGELAAVLEVRDLPSIAEWAPARVDYCESLPLGSELVVAQQLRRLGEVSLPRKGRPVRGESGSLRWGKGALKPKLYSKYLESADPAALGVLRYEVGAYRRRTFSALLGRMPGKPIALREVLSDQVRSKVLGRYGASLRGLAVSQQEMGDLEFLKEWQTFHGAGRGLQLLGWCIVWAATGYRTFQELEQSAESWQWNRASRYRALADLRRFRQEMVNKGKLAPSSTVEDVATRLAAMKEYAA